jgi:hypothetical protein
MMRFIGGELRLTRDYTWMLTIQLADEEGPQQLQDEGRFEENGAEGTRSGCASHHWLSAAVHSCARRRSAIS